MGMLAPRKFLQKRRKMEVFKDAADETDQKRWRGLMLEIESTGSAVPVLKQYRTDGDQGLPRDLVLGTLVRFKQLKKWNLVSEVWRKNVCSLYALFLSDAVCDLNRTVLESSNVCFAERNG